MPNIRIIHDDAAERAEITLFNQFDTAAGSLPPNSLKSNTKSLVHRSTGTSVTYQLTWSTAETIGGVILPAVNLSSLATIRVFGGGLDSGTIPACPNTPLDSYPGVKNVNSFPYGGFSKVAVWFGANVSIPAGTVFRISLNDTNKATKGYPAYIDCSRIVCGSYWEPSFNVSKNSLSLAIEDTTQISRSDAGDLIADRGTINEKLSFNFDVLSKTDKEELVKILRNVGTYRNIAVSIIPGYNNSRDEQDYIIYGKKDASSIDYIVHNYYSSSFSITGW